MILLVSLVFAVIVTLALIWLTRHDAMQRGKDAVDKQTSKEIIEDVHTANQIRDMLDHNADYARRLRERFTRD